LRRKLKEVKNMARPTCQECGGHNFDLTAKTPKRDNLLKILRKIAKKALTFSGSYDNITS
jgi:transposase-like protein